MFCRLSRLVFFASVLFGMPSFGSIVGWIAVIRLSEYAAKIGGYNNLGVPQYTAGYTGNTARQERYIAGSIAPTMQSLGLVQYCDLAGNPAPQPPFHGPFNFWEVMDLRVYAVNDELADLSALGDLSVSKPISPVYGASNSSPHSFLLNGNSQYAGVNPSFGSDGSLNIIQGNVSPAYEGVPQYYYYTPSGGLEMTDTPNSSIGSFVWDDSSGSYVYQPYTDSSSGSLDVSPVVDAVNNQGSLTRAELVRLLGSAGNSWVYDCSLSLSQLYSLATSQGLITRPQIDLSSIQSSLDTIAAKQYPSVDVSGLATESTLDKINTRLTGWNAYMQSNFNNINAIRNLVNDNLHSAKLNTDTIKSDLSDIKDILTGWDNTSPPSIPSPDFGDDDPDDDLPFDVSNFTSDASQVIGQLTEWGNNGVSPVFDFGLIDGFLTRIVGTIPSVGTDSHMFSFDLELPVIGHINREWYFSDIPFIPEFRQFCLWLLYVIFGFAMFKTLHASIF